MRVVVGSVNPSKVDAVRETISLYHLLRERTVVGVNAPSGVKAQPLTLDETIQGARQRAEAAWQTHSLCDGEYTIGIEAGLMAVPHTKTGYMNVCVCAIYDGKHHHLGLSSCFEYPTEIVRLVHEGIEVSDAVKITGLTAKERVGYDEGVIGILTKGKLSRKEYIKQAVINALIHIENPELY